MSRVLLLFASFASAFALWISPAAQAKKPVCSKTSDVVATLPYRGRGHKRVLDSVSGPLGKLLAKLKKAAKSHRLRVEVHTSRRGSSRYNLRLSGHYARAIQAFLIKRGIPAARLEARGFGKSCPRIRAYSRAARKANKRVQIVRIRGAQAGAKGRKGLARRLVLPYASGAAQLSAQDQAKMKRFAFALLRKKGSWKLKVMTHTDLREPAPLSRRRLQSALNLLRRWGIPAHRLQGSSAGTTRPIATNRTAKGRSLNRRIELRW